MRTRNRVMREQRSKGGERRDEGAEGGRMDRRKPARKKERLKRAVGEEGRNMKESQREEKKS
jgi:hypothetical protein